MVVDWTKLWPLILTSSVIAAFLTYGLGLFKDWLNRNRDADFAALYVALTLEDYASRCASVAGDNWSSSGSAGKQYENVPEMADFGSNVEWKALGIKLTSKALSFRVRVGHTREMLSDLAQHIAEQISEDAHEHCVKLGLEAIAIAEDFRKDRKLGAAHPVSHWSAKTWLMEKSAQIAEAKAERTAREEPDLLSGEAEG
ncbi:hypothetical protein [Brevundimonas sp. C43]|uniref:hypothetical protein n=1 Tax=Brevundimonas sp. C43 TaxID=3068314 RepID=UPI00273EEE01|nr:hypothetical protein [Brevundimonas sp. C43]